MKVVVIGGTGLIGSKLVAKLNEHGHEAVPAAPNTGVNTLTGEGLAEVLTGATTTAYRAAETAAQAESRNQYGIGVSKAQGFVKGLTGGMSKFRCCCGVV